ncbi:MAG: hypothetical protein JW806_07400 [Sedimentisphaerales bacterium]|nr:hypothetical protein [Sedimentisphaerales bacterium]
MLLQFSNSWNNYYGQINQNIIVIIPSDAKCVLSVGCGAGATEEELVKRGRHKSCELQI